MLGRNGLEFFLVPTEQIQDVVYSLEVYPLPKGYARVTGRAMVQEGCRGVFPLWWDPWILILHIEISILHNLPLGCRIRSRKINSNCT